MLDSIGGKNNNKFIQQIHFLFLLSFLLVHQGKVKTDVLKCYIDFLLKAQSKNV